jgi:isopropylmalate/homocitrate/citramalate synthase
MTTPWKTDKYFVSPLNYLPEVTKDFHLPAKIKIHDITLRDGEQETGIALQKDEKVAIAEALAEAGVHRIEAGMPAVSKQDENAIREIVKRNLGPEIFAFCRCILDDVRLAADCGVSGVIVEIPSSEHIIEYGYQWPLSKAIQASVDATHLAHELGLYTVFFTIDATRADFNKLFQIIEAVAADGHMDSLTLVDTMGVCAPPAIRHYVRTMRARLQRPLEAHFHNDFGLANANSLAAVEEGAEVVHSTVLGMGERAGQASTEQLALALELMYGIKTGIKLDRLYHLTQVVQKLTGHVTPLNQPVAGGDMYKLESGIPANWWLRCKDEHPTEVFPVLPSLIGQSGVEVVLGKGSGTDSVAYWLSRIGQPVPALDQLLELTMQVKEISMAKHGLLTESEFRGLVDRFQAEQA